MKVALKKIKSKSSRPAEEKSSSCLLTDEPVHLSWNELWAGSPRTCYIFFKKHRTVADCWIQRKQILPKINRTCCQNSFSLASAQLRRFIYLFFSPESTDGMFVCLSDRVFENSKHLLPFGASRGRSSRTALTSNDWRFRIQRPKNQVMPRGGDDALWPEAVSVENVLWWKLCVCVNTCLCVYGSLRPCQGKLKGRLPYAVSLYSLFIIRHEPPLKRGEDCKLWLLFIHTHSHTRSLTHTHTRTSCSLSWLLSPEQTGWMSKDQTCFQSS